MKYFLCAINEAKIRGTATAEGIRTHLVGSGAKYYGAVFVTELEGDPAAELAELRLAIRCLETRLNVVTGDYEEAARKTERLGQELDVLRTAYANACKERRENTLGKEIVPEARPASRTLPDPIYQKAK